MKNYEIAKALGITPGTASKYFGPNPVWRIPYPRIELWAEKIGISGVELYNMDRGETRKLVIKAIKEGKL